MLAGRVYPQATGLPQAGWFNVRDYGAVADGVTDDAPAINLALAACIAAQGGTVFVPQGRYRIKTAITATTATDGSSITLRGVGGSGTVILVDTGSGEDCIRLVNGQSVDAILEVSDFTFIPPVVNNPGDINCRRMVALISAADGGAYRITRCEAHGIYSGTDMFYFFGGMHFFEDFVGGANSAGQTNGDHGLVRFAEPLRASARHFQFTDEGLFGGQAYGSTATSNAGIWCDPHDFAPPRFIEAVSVFSVDDGLMDEGQGKNQIMVGTFAAAGLTRKAASLSVRNCFFLSPGAFASHSILARQCKYVDIEDCNLSWNETLLTGIALFGVDSTYLKHVKCNSTGSSILTIDDPLFGDSPPTCGSVVVEDCDFTAIQNYSALSTSSPCVVIVQKDGVRAFLRAPDGIIATANVFVKASDGTGAVPTDVIQMGTGDSPQEAYGVVLDAAPTVGTGSITCVAPAGMTLNGPVWYIGDGFNKVRATIQPRNDGNPASPGSVLMDVTGLTTAAQVAALLASTINGIGSACRATAVVNGGTPTKVSLTKQTGYGNNFWSWDHLAQDVGINSTIVDWTGGGLFVRVAQDAGQVVQIKVDGAAGISPGNYITLSTVSAGRAAKVAAGPGTVLALSTQTVSAVADTLLDVIWGKFYIA